MPAVEITQGMCNVGVSTDESYTSKSWATTNGKREDNSNKYNLSNN
jgi:hypothetical protein